MLDRLSGRRLWCCTSKDKECNRNLFCDCGLVVGNLRKHTIGPHIGSPCNGIVVDGKMVKSANCPKCRQKYTHSGEECHKMTCPRESCKTLFCFVCGKDIYKERNAHGPGYGHYPALPSVLTRHELEEYKKKHCLLFPDSFYLGNN